MRKTFDEHLKTLNNEMILLGSLCESSIETASRLLYAEDKENLDKIQSLMDDILQKSREIETLCMRLLLQQQPVAKDLREISSALKMIYDLERIGDQAYDIAEITPYIWNSDLKEREDVIELSKKAMEMVKRSVDAYVARDLSQATQVIAFDDVIDDSFTKIKQKLVRRIEGGAADGEACIDLLMIAKYLERIGDHAENFAGWVVYLITGTHTEELI